MNALLDTHALLWWLSADKELSSAAKAVIDNSDNQRFISSVSAFEIANKFRLGKLPMTFSNAADFDFCLSRYSTPNLPARCLARIATLSIGYLPLNAGSKTSRC